MPKRKITEAVADRGNELRKRAATSKALDGIFKRMVIGSTSEVTEVIPSGLEVLDRYVLGVGGWPVKRVCELYSEPSAGKTSLGFAALASTQREGGVAILIETESALQVARVTIFGVDLEDIYLSEPESIEGVLEGIRLGLEAIPANVGPNIIVWDSIAMSQLQAVNDAGAKAKDGMAGKAALMGKLWPSLTRAASHKRTAMLLINQARTKIGISFGNPTTTPGGDTHKFTASARLQMWAGSQVKKGEHVVGMDTTIMSFKNKIALPFHKAKLRLLFESGWDDRWSTINHAKDRGVIKEGEQVSKKKSIEELHAEARRALGWEAA